MQILNDIFNNQHNSFWQIATAYIWLYYIVYVPSIAFC